MESPICDTLSSQIKWPADVNLQGLTLRGHSIKFEPVLETDFSSVTNVIAEHFIPDEPLIRAIGSGAALLSAKQNPESAESVEFWRQTNAFVGSFFISPAIASRPHLSFKVVTNSESNSAKDQQVIGVAFAHLDYIDSNEKFSHFV